MAAKQRSTVVGVFEDRRDADQAVAELKRAGFRDDQIGVAMRHAEGSTEAAKTDDTYAEEGAVAGVRRASSSSDALAALSARSWLSFRRPRVIR